MLDHAWHNDAKKIYDNYTIYHQSRGIEQSVFDPMSGQAMSRSARLLQRLQNEVPLLKAGRMMDIGCGNGALLRAFSAMNSAWSLAGVEVNDRYRETVESVRGVERLFTCQPGEVPGRFHLISLMHALEHIPSPREFISRLSDKLEPDGLLLIQVPDCEANPFMFLVADHATHFFAPTLKAMVEGAGYRVAVAANDWVSKEITIVAQRRVGGAGRDAAQPVSVKPDVNAPGTVKQRLRWLSQQVEAARQLASKGNFGLFGTSIAATWLFAESGGNVRFFVDEDPHRAGGTCFDRPIFRPQDAPPDSDVFIALPSRMANGIKSRMEGAGAKARFHAPPPLGPE